MIASTLQEGFIHPGALVKLGSTSSTGKNNPKPNQFHKVVYIDGCYVEVEAIDTISIPPTKLYCCTRHNKKVLCFYRDSVKQIKSFSSNPELVKEK